MKKEKSRPGIMLYFDIRPSLKLISTEEKGLLLEAMLDYAEDGILPELTGKAEVVWTFMKKKIDDDAERYEEICRKRRDAANARVEKDKLSKCYQMQPTTTSTSKTKSKTTTKSKSESKSSTVIPWEKIEPMDPEEFERERERILASLVNGG